MTLFGYFITEWSKFSFHHLNGESNNIEQDNEGELEDDFEVYDFEED